jgi:hypothetical protein
MVLGGERDRLAQLERFEAAHLAADEAKTDFQAGTLAGDADAEAFTFCPRSQSHKSRLSRGGGKARRDASEEDLLGEVRVERTTVGKELGGATIRITRASHNWVDNMQWGNAITTSNWSRWSPRSPANVLGLQTSLGQLAPFNDFQDVLSACA